MINETLITYCIKLFFCLLLLFFQSNILAQLKTLLQITIPELEGYDPVNFYLIYLVMIKLKVG